MSTVMECSSVGYHLLRATREEKRGEMEDDFQIV